MKENENKIVYCESLESDGVYSIDTKKLKLLIMQTLILSNPGFERKTNINDDYIRGIEDTLFMIKYFGTEVK